VGCDRGRLSVFPYEGVLTTTMEQKPQRGYEANAVFTTTACPELTPSLPHMRSSHPTKTLSILGATPFGAFGWVQNQGDVQ